jgi:hypothetical protein
METESLMKSIITEIHTVLSPEDLILFHEFLSKNEIKLAIEFMCDRLFEREIKLPESLGRKIRVLCEKLELSPYETWRGILVKNEDGELIEQMNPISPDWASPLREILERVRDRMEPGVAALIQDYLTQCEIEIAIEDMCHALIYYKIPISQKDVDILRTFWLDLGHNPTEFTGFLIQEDEEK